MTIIEIYARLEEVQRTEDIAKEIEEIGWDLWAIDVGTRGPLSLRELMKVAELLAERRRLEREIA